MENGKTRGPFSAHMNEAPMRNHLGNLPSQYEEDGAKLRAVQGMSVVLSSVAVGRSAAVGRCCCCKKMLL